MREPVKINVAKYRNRIDALSQAFASLLSAATPAERTREAAWVVRTAVELSAARCPRARQADHDRATALLERSQEYLARLGL
jgi:hypothetical protein